MSQLTTVTEDQSGADDLPNNPAGRVLRFLRDFEAQTVLAPKGASVLVIQELLGDQPESAGMYSHMTRLRLQAESVPELMQRSSSVGRRFRYKPGE
jgi:hypothetical protein